MSAQTLHHTPPRRGGGIGPALTRHRGILIALAVLPGVLACLALTGVAALLLGVALWVDRG